VQPELNIGGNKMFRAVEYQEHHQYYTSFGTIKLDQIPKQIQKYEMQAKKVLKKTGVDHVIYASKVYDKNGQLETLNIYAELIPLNDSEFAKRVAGAKNYLIYALHKN